VILLDTGPLVALTDPRDALHARALADLDRIKRGETFYTCLPALSEACFHLPGEAQRQRLRLWVSDLSISPLDTPDEESPWDAVFQWMAKYAEHSPDFADAWLAVLCGTDRRLKVWTYDRQFWTIWRRPDGTPIPLAVEE
jgi:predicted nucleic acid-binding protein